MKRTRVSYEKWTCIQERTIKGRWFERPEFQGYLGLIRMKRVTGPQIWHFDGREVTVCRDGYQWLVILPREGGYCITAMMDEQADVALWYIDMIADQGVDPDGVPFFHDLYLDLVVYKDGSLKVDDMDDLQQALSSGDIDQTLFDRAIETAERLQKGLLTDIPAFHSDTRKKLEMLLREG